jgi:hypothetical protein
MRQDAHFLLIQEHRLLPDQVGGAQVMSQAMGWKGVWTPAQQGFRAGRSGGLAILGRDPLLVVADTGDYNHRYLKAVVPLTRRVGVHLYNVYGWDRTQEAEAQNDDLHDRVRADLAKAGRVPFVVGGDWNLEPDEVMHGWRAPGRVHGPGRPTNKFQREVDWFLVSPALPGCAAEVWPGFPVEDHVPISLKIPGLHEMDFGWRLLSPAAVPGDATATGSVPAPATPPVDTWEQWTEDAEEWLARAFGVQRTRARRGAPPVFGRGTLSSPQGWDGDAVNTEVRELEERVRRVRRIRALECRTEPAATAERDALRQKAGDDGQQGHLDVLMGELGDARKRQRRVRD